MYWLVVLSGVMWEESISWAERCAAYIVLRMAQGSKEDMRTGERTAPPAHQTPAKGNISPHLLPKQYPNTTLRITCGVIMISVLIRLAACH